MLRSYVEIHFVEDGVVGWVMAELIPPSLASRRRGSSVGIQMVGGGGSSCE